jgi:hypothetical protein
MEVTTKLCKRCNTIKATHLFSKSSSSKDGFRRTCKACDHSLYEANKTDILEKQKAYYNTHKEEVRFRNDAWARANPDKFNGYRAAYCAKNPERVFASKRAYAEANPDKESARSKRYRERFPEQVVASAKRWQQANRDKGNATHARYRASKVNGTPIWFEKELVAAVYAEAIERSKSEGLTYHVDHIVPIQSKFVCGLHCLANLQIITGKDNRRKGNRTWPGKEWILSEPY